MKAVQSQVKDIPNIYICKQQATIEALSLVTPKTSVRQRCASLTPPSLQKN